MVGRDAVGRQTNLLGSAGDKNAVAEKSVESIEGNQAEGYVWKRRRMQCGGRSAGEKGRGFQKNYRKGNYSEREKEIRSDVSAGGLHQ